MLLMAEVSTVVGGPGIDPADGIALVLSLLAFLVSLTSLLFVLTATPRLRVNVTRVQDHGRFVGEVVSVYNVGRKGAAIVEVGIPGTGGSLWYPAGEIKDGMTPSPARLPVVIEAGGVATFHFRTGTKEMEKARASGYVLTTVGRKLPWRGHGLKRMTIPRTTEIGTFWD